MSHYFLQGFPPIKGVRWFNVAVLLVTPVLGAYGLMFGRPYQPKTMAFALMYYLFSVIGASGHVEFLVRSRVHRGTQGLQQVIIVPY